MSDLTFILPYVEDVARSAEFYARLHDKPVPESSAPFAPVPAAPALTLADETAVETEHAR